jgi:fucose 4-O-acetylase-like acetyltransferase
MSIERSQAVDLLKGVMIILVVAGHVPAPTGNFWIPLFQECLYMFHMPAFFILGSLYLKSFKKELISAIPLLVCYVFWVVLHRRDLDIAAQVIIYSNWNTLKSILWFLPAIISFKLLLSFQPKNTYWRIGVLGLLGFCSILFHNQLQVAHQYIPWGLDIAFYLIPIALIAKFHFDFEMPRTIMAISDMQKYVLFTIIFLIFSILFFIRVPLNTFTVWQHRLDLAQFSVPSFEGYFYLTFMMLAMIGIAKIKVEKNIISFIGRKSLSIFIFHLLVIELIKKYLFPVDNIFTWALVIIVSIILCMSISTVLLKISRQFRYIGA